MPRRIDIELTSALPDGSWTWRAAGAQKPKGVVRNDLLPGGAAIGDELKVEVEQMMDGIEILSVVKGREKQDATNVLDLIPSDKPFEAVIETKAKRGRGDGRSDGRGRGRDGEGRGRGRDGDSRGKGRDGDSRGKGRDGDSRGKGRDGDSRGKGGDGESRGGRDGGNRDRKPRFDTPPEVPQRPKPKRLRPGKARRQELLSAVPEEQRPIAELALQGMAAVRTRVKEENAKLKADGKPEMPEASVTKMAEDMLPKLRVAEWLDRAEAAKRQMEHLDLRDLRSVVATGDDSIVARDETARALAAELKEALFAKQTQEMANWLEDVEAALTVGRVIRALRLSSQPPKAGVMFPPDLARRLGEAATTSLLPDDSGDRWSAVLEAAAFSPVRALIVPATPPTTIDDDLKKTALRLGPLLPQVAALLGVEVPAGTARPKPLRPQQRKDTKGQGKRGSGERSGERSGGRDGGRDGERSGGRDGERSGGRDGGRDGGRGRDRDGRDGGRGRGESKGRPKGMRDVAEVMAAKKAAEAAEAEAQAAAEAAAAEAAEAEANAAASAEASDGATPAEPGDDATTAEASDGATPAEPGDDAATAEPGDDDSAAVDSATPASDSDAATDDAPQDEPDADSASTEEPAAESPTDES